MKNPQAPPEHNSARQPTRCTSIRQVSARTTTRANMPVITCIEDLRVLAEKRVPRMFYDYADSGSWTESTYRANEADFQTIKLRQRVAVDMEGRSTATTMIGRDVAMPVAIAPTG